ncbi:MAG: PEP-CTERM sorting domain-containing protein [Phycisphaerae bacterium]|nr:PEP-CTERM sorting domain-containing protein [Phycisphaerae bacterium]
MDLAALGLRWSPGGYGGPSQAPEPAAMALLAAGLAIIGIGRRRR